MSPKTSDGDATLKCRGCGASNRFPVDKALQDLTRVLCGQCKGELLRARGEPLPDLDPQALMHPLDREALDKLRAIPLMDKIISKVMGTTVDKHFHFRQMASSVRVSEAQVPRLWGLYLEACGRLNVEPVPLFIEQNPQMNAYASGAGSPVISVTTGLLDRMEDREILGVLGHELTHVKLGHVLYRTLAMLVIRGGLSALDGIFGIGSLLAKPIQLALFRWYQMAELSADRGELVTLGSARTAVRTHLLLAGGTTRFMDELDENAFIAQADEAEALRDSDILLWVLEMMASTHRSHPFPAWRVHHVLKFARSEDFFRILAGKHTLKLTP